MLLVDQQTPALLADSFVTGPGLLVLSFGQMPPTIREGLAPTPTPTALKERVKGKGCWWLWIWVNGVNRHWIWR